MNVPCVGFTRLLERVYPGFTMSVGVLYHTVNWSVLTGHWVRTGEQKMSKATKNNQSDLFVTHTRAEHSNFEKLIDQPCFELRVDCNRLEILVLDYCGPIGRTVISTHDGVELS